MALYLDLAPGAAVRVGETTITVEAKSGSRTRLRIEGPDRVQQITPEVGLKLTRATPQRMSAAVGDSGA